MNVCATKPSGCTKGAIQFGLDAFSLIGVKLYSDPFKTRTNLLETNEFGNASDVYMEVGGSLKVKYNDTILTYGNQFHNLPVISTNTVRLLPSVSSSVTIKDSPLQNLVLNAGYFYSLNPIDSTSSISAFTTDYTAGIKGDSVSFLGGNYSVNKNSEISIYYSELEDIWRQTYVGAKHTIDLKTDNHRLNFSFVGFNNKHWERDIQVAYNVQSGFAKRLDIKLRQATHRVITRITL